MDSKDNDDSDDKHDYHIRMAVAEQHQHYIAQTTTPLTPCNVQQLDKSVDHSCSTVKAGKVPTRQMMLGGVQTLDHNTTALPLQLQLLFYNGSKGAAEQQKQNQMIQF